MAFESVSTLPRFYKFKETQPGVLFDAWFVREFQGKFGNCFEFIDEAGQKHILNDAGKLAHLMENVAPEEFVRIIYKGQSVIEKGIWKGTKAHDFDILRDRSKAGLRKKMAFEPVANKEDETSISDLIDEDEVPF